MTWVASVVLQPRRPFDAHWLLLLLLLLLLLAAGVLAVARARARECRVVSRSVDSQAPKLAAATTRHRSAWPSQVRVRDQPRSAG